MGIVDVLPWLIAAFFAAGAAINALAPRSIREDYARWGYPAWFHVVTAGLELTVVALLLIPEARWAGGALGGLVMAAAAGTTLINREYKRAIAPSAVLLLTILLVATIALSQRSAT